MSNIYISEPPTFGKVLLETSVGDIDIELWAKETPKACKNFVQLCLEGYYNGTIFHRVVKGFIAQGGDPTGTGEGGESIYGEPFKDEIHSRLRFSRRGLLAMANAGKDDNGSQFFFTFAACPELQGKHTIFGKVTGETLYNMLKLEDALTNPDDRPVYPHKILKVQILNNPFPDIMPRVVAQRKEEKKKSKDKERTGVKNFKLLSFGEEAEEDEVESSEVSASLFTKGKSTHDVLDDPKLSSVPAVEAEESIAEKEVEKKLLEEKLAKERLDTVKEKLNKKRRRSRSKEREVKEQEEDRYYFGKDEEDRKKKRLAEIQKEIKELKRDYQKDRKKESEDEEDDKDEAKPSQKEDNTMIEDYKSNLEKYGSKKKDLALKGASREAFTLSLLAKFQKKLHDAQEQVPDGEAPGEAIAEDAGEEGELTENWLNHKLNFENSTPVLAKDANRKSDDWFDITDPRHAINKRRRETEKDKKKHSKT